MDCNPDTLLDALASGDSERVNDAIDTVEDADFEERVELFETCFDRCRELYRGGDGYQRQSVVRFLEALNPRMRLNQIAELDEIDSDQPVVEQVDHDLGHAEQLAEFYLTTIQDDDGRVRNSTKRAIKDICLGYEMYGEKAPIEALAEVLDELADEYTGKKQEHIQEALEQVQFYLQPHGQRLGTALHRLATEAA